MINYQALTKRGKRLLQQDKNKKSISIYTMATPFQTSLIKIKVLYKHKYL